MKRTLINLALLISLLSPIDLFAQNIIISGPDDCGDTANVGTWIVPNWVNYITVDVYGGGGAGGGSGGGANGGLYNTRGGGGGGAGGHTSITIDVVPGASFSFSAGAGGCGGEPSSDFDNGDNGLDGVFSTFSGVDANGDSVNLLAGGGLGGIGGEGMEGLPGVGGLGGTAFGGSTNLNGASGSDGIAINHGEGGDASGAFGGAGGSSEGEEGEDYGGGGAGGAGWFGGNGGRGAIIISGPLNVGKYEDELKLTLIPNPVVNQARLNFVVDKKGRFDISFLDVTGKLLKTVYNGHLNTGTQQFDLTSQLPEKPGTYLIQIQHSQGRNIKKLVLLR